MQEPDQEKPVITLTAEQGQGCYRIAGGFVFIVIFMMMLPFTVVFVTVFSEDYGFWALPLAGMFSLFVVLRLGKALQKAGRKAAQNAYQQQDPSMNPQEYRALAEQFLKTGTNAEGQVDPARPPQNPFKQGQKPDLGGEPDSRQPVGPPDKGQAGGVDNTPTGLGDSI